MKRSTALWLILFLGLMFASLPLSAQDATPTLEPTATPGVSEPIKCGDLAPPTAAPPYYIGLGNVYFDRGDYSRAIVAYTCATQLDGTYAPAYVSRGFALAAQLNNDAARADYDTALALDGNLVSAYNNYGLLYASEGNFGLALTQLNLAVALAPDNPAGYTNRGIVHAIEGNFDLALADIQQAITLNADYAPAHAALGAVYSALSSASYQRYRDVAGEGAVLPGVTPENILRALLQRADTGDFSIWLSFFVPAR